MTAPASDTNPTHVDVVIVGAGISGIGAARHLRKRCPNLRFVILEARADIGGTWDLFRYPGIRSDSDMHTLGYAFKPWTSGKAIADGPAILDYLRETVEENDLGPQMRFGHRVQAADWSSANARWTLAVQTDQGMTRYACNFLFMCSGYYDYRAGYLPDYPGVEAFGGELVHPQHWPEDLDYAGKRVVVIGSGATAVTLVPELARRAAQVTMLQRSPTYVVAQPDVDSLALTLRRWLPERVAYALTRWKNISLGSAFFALCRWQPQRVRRWIVDAARARLAPKVDVDRHFNPRYAPWDQRMCLAPNGDLFTALESGSAQVVTAHIERFVSDGLRLQDGTELAADIVVSATGLNLQVLGGAVLRVDGEPVTLSDTLAYKGMMFSGVPNLALSMGYTNASWTLKCDLTCTYVCRLLNHMIEHEVDYCVPKREHDVAARPFIDLRSGYIDRGRHLLPQQGARRPWRLRQNYLLDRLALSFGAIDDGVLEFGRVAQEPWLVQQGFVQSI